MYMSESVWPISQRIGINKMLTLNMHFSRLWLNFQGIWCL